MQAKNFSFIGCGLVFLLSMEVGVAQEKVLSVKSYQISFKIKNLGFYVDGSLQGLESRIVFSPEKLDKSSIEASVKSATINTHNQMRDNHLRKADYFDVARYPTIRMQSKRFVALQQNNHFIGYFDLTIKNKTHEVAVPFSYREGKSTAILQGQFTINRRDFAVGGSSLILSDEVLVNIKIEVNL